MSYTPAEQEIDEETEALKVAIENFTTKATARLRDPQEWSCGHRNKLRILRQKLQDVEELLYELR